MGLKLYNTLSRTKEEFSPLNPDFVGMYICGPTVYSEAHLGHAKSYISFDILFRYLQWLGYKVKYVQNITDVGHLLDTGEDRILMGAKREKLHPMELAEKYTYDYFSAMDMLNVMRPSITPRASGHVPEQIELIETLLRNGYAYEVGGSVYFDIAKFQGYGKLSNRKFEDQLAGARVEVKSEKRYPNDFALWIKAPPEHIMQWKSPWGYGYPGWHIECSAMAMKYLGDTIDIHGGGMENIFPHHECEIAQSECATGKQFVRYWVHNNMILARGIKMSKSLGNFVSIKDALLKYSGEELRFFILNSHYRSVVDFSEKALQSSGEGVKRIHTTFKRVQELLLSVAEGGVAAQICTILDEHKQKFVSAMDDDLNTPQALSVLFEFSHKINEYLDKSEPTKATVLAILDLYESLGGKVLGILPFSQKPLIEGTQFIELLIELRSKLRTIKQWELADEIRSRLAEMSIVLEDTKDWKSRRDRTLWKHSK